MPRLTAPPIITATNLSYIRNHEMLIQDFSFEIRTGDYVGVIGPNGGGKTTLLRLLLGLLKPTSGEIHVLEGKPTDVSVRKQIGYVPQRGGNLDLQFPATVEEVVRSGRTTQLGFLEHHGGTHEQIVQQTMMEMGIDELQGRPISQLSGGERQKVLLARAMVAQPKILYLDEPLDGLDPASRETFYEQLRHINEAGVTIIFVSHDVHAIAKEANSAICLKHQLVCHGDNACHIDRRQLRDLFHPDREDILSHHHTH